MEEIARRRLRAREERFKISNQTPEHPVFSNFSVLSRSGQNYEVEIRAVDPLAASCSCVDYRTSGLGTCKHCEAVLIHIRREVRRQGRQFSRLKPSRAELFLDPAAGRLRLQLPPGSKMPPLWSAEGFLLESADPAGAVDALAKSAQMQRKSLRISAEVRWWLERRARNEERRRLRRQYELKVQSGKWPPQETTVPLFPYQREGMLHLAFSERALLADEMGLGKTIQAIAACALVHRLGNARRALVVTPASLKTEWEEQAQRFTPLTLQVVYGSRGLRRQAYARDDCFFTIVNYEQVLADWQIINQTLRPDIVVLDEAQRIKNWRAKTAMAVKRLRSRYAFVLTGTPIENRLDELRSIMDFVDPELLGPLFRFNREYYQLNEEGRPIGYRNLGPLREKIRTVMLRRRKSDVETELPERSDRNHFVKLLPAQVHAYEFHEKNVALLVRIAKARPLLKLEQDRLQRELAMMRMTCDANFILEGKDRSSPKIDELEKILETCAENGAKAIVFSEWERMLQLVRERCEKLGWRYAWHTGKVPAAKRRLEINEFKTNPRCPLFLSTDSGSTGLNLQVASVVVNCDLPWNPARLEQRVGRAWRKFQTRAVTVVNLIAENTIEHRMLATLANKQALSDGVLDGRGDLGKLQFGGGQKALLERLEKLMSQVQPPPPPPADPFEEWALRTRTALSSLSLEFEEAQLPGNNRAWTVVSSCSDQNLEDLARDYFNQVVRVSALPEAPMLHVISRETQAQLQRMLDAGLLERRGELLRRI